MFLTRQPYLHPFLPQVFDLGASGTSPATRVAEVGDVHAAACAALGSGGVFHASDRKGSAVKHMTPISERRLLFDSLLLRAACWLL